MKDTKKAIVKAYISFVKKNFRHPTRVDLANFGFGRDLVRRHYGSHTELREFVKNNFPSVFEKVVDESLFTQKNFERLKGDVGNYKRFLITTAVTGAPVNKKFLKSIKSYCEKNEALLLILPVTDPASKAGWALDHNLANEHFVFQDLALNSNVFISSIKMSAKHIDPITGLSRIGQRNGSFIYASPKQRLEFVAVSNKKLPHALMTTGAITDPAYQTARYLSERTAYIAENDHVLGAIIVEVEDEDIFYFRQIQAEPSTGNFVDLAKYYKPNGLVVDLAPEAFVLGDYHAGDHDLSAKQAWKEVVELTNPKDLILHDMYNGKSISHHEKKKRVSMAIKAMEDKVSLDKELIITANEADELLTWIKGKLVWIKSNHDEWLERYLEEGEYVKDALNLKAASKLVSAMIEGKDPLQVGIETIGGLKGKNRIKWVGRDEDYMIGKIECGSHGDLEASLIAIEKAYGNAVTGHSHTPAILRGIFRVGTTSKLKLGYNRGASSWVHSSCLVYSNGSRQLINSIFGKWRLV